MQNDRYDFEVTEDCTTFFFDSIGPKGVIKKGVIFSRLGIWKGFVMYNLGFGDWSDELMGIDDSVKTNNGDRDKVLATVASTVLQFAGNKKRVMVLAKGATPARTRLYQMGINANLDEIRVDFWVFGEHKGILCPFEAGINYDMFFVVKK